MQIFALNEAETANAADSDWYSCLLALAIDSRRVSVVFGFDMIAFPFISASAQTSSHRGGAASILKTWEVIPR